MPATWLTERKNKRLYVKLHEYSWGGMNNKEKSILGVDAVYIQGDLSEVMLLWYSVLPHQIMVGLTTIMSSPRTCET